VTASPLRVAVSRGWHAARARLRGSAIVLTYHRVGDTSDDPHRLAVSTEHFAQQIAVVAREHPVLTAGELAGLMRSGKPFPQRAVVVTFDDGYAQSHMNACGILVDAGIRATSFLCSDVIGSGDEYPWDAETTAIERVSSDSAATAGPARPSRRVLDLDEVRTLAASDAFEFGAHTRTHPRLSELPVDRQREEIVGGKSSLEELLGERISTFAYPHGGPGQFDANSVDLAREAGFDAAFTTRPGIVVPWVDRFAVPRFHTEDVDGESFRSLLDRWFDAAR